MKKIQRKYYREKWRNLIEETQLYIVIVTLHIRDVEMWEWIKQARWCTVVCTCLIQKDMNVPTGPGPHPASYTMGISSYSRGWSGRGVALTTHLYLMPRLKNE
jgi:hypothetical protein